MTQPPPTHPDPASAPELAAEEQTASGLAGLVRRLRYELVPIKSVEQAISELPAGAPVSVTCSARGGLPATLDLTARLLDLGHDVVPHLAARLVEGREHVGRLAAWLRDHGVTEVFVVGGDADAPLGPYADGASFLRDLLNGDSGLQSVGVPAYPDGHPLIVDDVLRAALLHKQALLGQAGVRASATTQMCFDAPRIERWISDERAAGLTLPIDLGIPGVVSRTKLLSIGMRLGVGSSLRFLRKNRSSMSRMVSLGGYDPSDLTASLADRAAELGVTGLHAFTFNSVASTLAWQQSVVGEG